LSVIIGNTLYLLSIPPYIYLFLVFVINDKRNIYEIYVSLGYGELSGIVNLLVIGQPSNSAFGGLPAYPVGVAGLRCWFTGCDSGVSSSGEGAAVYGILPSLTGGPSVRRERFLGADVTPCQSSGEVVTLTAAVAGYAIRDVKTKIRAGIVRPVAAERRVLGLPKPNPPLERPFLPPPPESNRVLLRGGAGGRRGSGGKGAAGGEGNPE
jgi:hypothetical protein